MDVESDIDSESEWADECKNDDQDEYETDEDQLSDSKAQSISSKSDKVSARLYCCMLVTDLTNCIDETNITQNFFPDLVNQINGFVWKYLIHLEEAWSKLNPFRNQRL